MVESIKPTFSKLTENDAVIQKMISLDEFSCKLIVQIVLMQWAGLAVEVVGLTCMTSRRRNSSI